MILEGAGLRLRRELRHFPDHATFREKGAKQACADNESTMMSLKKC